MFSKLCAIARYTLLEYSRGRVMASGIAIALVTLALERLLDGVALTEAGAMQASLAGAAERFAVVLLLAAGVIVSQVREAGDRTREWLLSFPMPRHIWLSGRLLGHCAAALGLAGLAGLPLIGAAGGEAALLWTCGLALELLVCACMATFLSLTLPHTPAALLAFTGWYVLARSIAALQLIAAAPLLADGGLLIHASQSALAAIAALLPRFDLFAPGLWLEGQGHWSALLIPLLQTMAYVGLIGAASLVDLQRSEW
jgi:hypothetical protein